MRAGERACRRQSRLRPPAGRSARAATRASHLASRRDRRTAFACRSRVDGGDQSGVRALDETRPPRRRPPAPTPSPVPVATARTASGLRAPRRGRAPSRRLAPAGRTEAGGEVGQRGEHEQALPGARMGDLEPLDRRLRGVVAPGGGRALDLIGMAAEDEQVEVELAGAPALAVLPPEGALDRLEREQQGQCAGLRVGTGRDVEGDDRVAEVRLIRDADGRRGVQAGDTDEPGARGGPRGRGSPLPACPPRRRGWRRGRRRPGRGGGGRRGVAAGRAAAARDDLRALVSPCPENTRVGAVTVLVLHPPLPAGAGPLAGALDAARRELAARHLPGSGRRRASVALVEEGAAEPFGARLRRLAAATDTPGLVVLGSGAWRWRARPTTASSWPRPPPICLARWPTTATRRTRWPWPGPPSSATSRTSPPTTPCRAGSRRSPGTAWTTCASGPVSAFDLDSPADVVLAGGGAAAAAAGPPFPARWPPFGPCSPTVEQNLPSPGGVSGTLAALERRAACRVRALVEERGLRAASRLGPGSRGRPSAGRRDRPRRPSASSSTARPRGARAATRPARRRGGRGHAGAPGPSARRRRERLAATRGPVRVGPPAAGPHRRSWLRALAASAVAAPIPVLLGGHTLVGPGLRLLAEGVP